MKLKNPKLETSFSFPCGKYLPYYIHALDVYCRFDNDDGKVYYFLRGLADSLCSVSLDFCFFTPEEAFAMADRICSEYPFIDDFSSEAHEHYPQFDREKFIK